jgi:putative spermidine/putrescine transport system ATP-binding protein
MTYLKLEGLQKSFGKTSVVEHFDLDIEKGEFVSLLGPSGCGKTTVLRMVAGFENPTAGRISIEGQDITGLRPSQRNVGLVFQSYALFPNLNVAQNVAFGLKVARLSQSIVDQRVTEMLKMIGLPQLGQRYPFELSGGQQQRVALARALAVRPRVLLLDEPLSALDAKIRVNLRREIRDIQRELGITTIFVTHDQEEALSISDRVVVMNQGRAEQVGEPHVIYNRPATSFVANFVGTLNTFNAVVKDENTGVVTLGDVDLHLPRGVLINSNGETIGLAIRPEGLVMGRLKAPAVTLRARIEDVQFLGSVIRLRARVAGQTVSLDTFNRNDVAPPTIGATVEVSLHPRDLIVLGEGRQVDLSSSTTIAEAVLPQNMPPNRFAGRHRSRH